MSSREQRLAAKVKAVNRANQAMMELYPKLAAAFAPFVGQKILKADGVSLLAKVESQMPELPNGRNGQVQVYRNSRATYSLSFGVRTSENDSDCTCLYYEGTLYIGEIQGAVLTKLTPEIKLRTDYTEAEITAKRETLEAAKRAVSAAESALYPFGAEDR